MTARTTTKTARPATKGNPEKSFDDFWDEVHGGRRTTVVAGVEVAVPNDLPFGFSERFEALKDSESEDDAVELITLIFGQDAAEAWMAPPTIGTRKLFTILGWGMAHASGEDISFAEAHARVTESLTAEGKAPSGQNRAARRQQSAGTGGRSKRTSSASTGTARKTSRA
ncbi:hypothetical protein HRW18_05415 [Streptomyces lunaelactis]|uniref:hypothetical protein n=1 Tax=Streptomyces lunaelactis TaxID=1535768 RepID=UPI00158468AE|nr:hypothetical protein [Streptomyces lunaelactis]NUK07461.1 hypothetical protein [Streptomyces lunaelactis]